ncbi:MAG: fused response regulator/phosphatase [Spirochaetes bacterium]|nr:fused response regulator/phosphatase [Spirochaetota bacterium]
MNKKEKLKLPSKREMIKTGKKDGKSIKLEKDILNKKKKDRPVLIYVDDEVHNLNSFYLSFEDDFAIFTADNAEAGWKLLIENKNTAIVITDMKMPDINGAEFLKKVLTINSNPRRLILTAYAEPSYLMDSMNKGSAHRYILKPWQKQDLLMVLNEQLHIFNLEKTNREYMSQLELKVSERTRDLENALKIINNYLKLSKDIQQNILPRNLEEIENCDFYIKYLPMIEVGGDLYDIFEIESGYIRVFLADAIGHGIPAALITMIIKVEYESLKKGFFNNPAELLERINQNFLTRYEWLSVFFTCILIDIDLNKNELIYSAGGHPTQYIIEKNGLRELESTGKLIGIVENTKYHQRKEKLSENDKILLFTDGLFEEFNQGGEIYGENRLIEVVKEEQSKSISEIVEKILHKMYSFTKGTEIGDDITIIGFERKSAENKRKKS